MAYVTAPSLWWPHQSVVGDILQFMAFNTSWRDFRPAKPRLEPQVGRAWEALGLKTSSRTHHGILECMHGGVPPTNRWVDGTWIPKVLRANYRSRAPDALRVCRLCLAVGFHSPIQQLPWILKCPLHPTESLVGCPHDGPGASLWFGALQCDRCRLSSPSALTVATRGAPSARGIRIVDRYLEFIAACEPLDQVAIWRFIRLPDRAPAHHLVCDFAPSLHFVSRAPKTFASEAVKVLIHELGFADVLDCVTQSHVEVKRVYAKHSFPDTIEDPQSPRQGGALQTLIAAGATGRTVGEVMADHFGEFLSAMQCSKRDSRLPQIDDYFVTTLNHRQNQQRGPLCEGAPQWVRRCFRAALGLIGRAITAHAGCHEPFRHLSGETREEPQCVLCGVAFRWRQAIEQGYAFDDPWFRYGSGVFPSIVDLPPSSAVQQFRRQLLLRDMLALFAAIARLRSLGRIAVASPEAQDCLHDMSVLHRGFMGFASAEGIHFMTWNPVDVGTVIRRLGLACTCPREQCDETRESKTLRMGASPTRTPRPAFRDVASSAVR